MFRKLRTSVVCVLLVVLVCGVASAFLIARATRDSSAPSTQHTSPRLNSGRRNVSLQPEAVSVSRRLGRRFNASSRAVSSSSGNLAIRGVEQPITIVRNQTDSGETVQLLLGTRSFSWSEREGLKSFSGLATDVERLLIEQMVFDSPEQFVLAQLRGASYFTVARNVRPTDAVDGYSGALWNLVRVNEPPAEENLKPLIPWRIYYINVQTGLPDRVEYQLDGKEIRAEFLDWTEAQGEKTAALVRWSSDGQTIMEYRATSVSHNQ